MPWFEVLIEATQLIVVEAENPEKAAKVAVGAAFEGVDCDKEFYHPKKIIDDNELDSVKGFAHLVLPEEDED